MSVKLDHIVYCVTDLKTAINTLGAQLGIEPIIGGSHPDHGTHNALLKLSDDSYLEILAIDKSVPALSKARWMGIDFLTSPKITRWCISSDIIAEQIPILESYAPEMGVHVKGSRLTPNGNKLKWDMTLPLATPEVETIPFLIDWSQSSQHPTDSLETGCSLTQFSISHPDPDYIRLMLKVLHLDIEVKYAPQAKITALITGPKGSITL